jgi:hypothetical protein
MRGALTFAALVALAAGCGDLFKTSVPEGYACSPSGGCPPGQQCVPNEKVCRTPCTQTNVPGNGTGGQPTTQCDIQQDNSNGSMFISYACDVDHFCRPSCNGAFNGSCGACAGTDVCDPTVNICRPACGGGCPTSWGCVAEDSGNMGGGTAAICLACQPLAPSTFVPPTFAPIVYYDTGVTGQHTFSVAVGDLVGNGRPSVIAVDLSAKQIYVYGNNGDGTLAAPTAYTPGGSPYHATVVDITEDGKADIVVASTPQPVVFAGNGDGTLAAPKLGPTIPTTDLVAGDFDNDGKPDVAFCGSGTRQLSLTTADGAGGLKVIATFTNMNNAASYVRIGAADFNGDHKLDLYTDDLSLGYTIFANPGGSTFTFTPGNANGGGAGGTRIDTVAFDATGDGKPDLVAIQGSAPIGMPSTSWSLQITTYNAGGFNSTMQTALPGASAIAAGDFDGDGKVDAAVADGVMPMNNAVHILSNVGTTLAYSATFAVARGPGSIAVADLDGDGKPDIVLGLGSGIGVLMNTTPAH